MFNAEVTVGSVSANFINAININDLKLTGTRGAAPVAEVKKIALRFSWWKLLLSRDFDSSLKEIVLVDPVVTGTCQKGRWDLAGLVNIPAHDGKGFTGRLTVKNGTVIIIEDTGRVGEVQFRKINGLVTPADNGWYSFRLRFASNLSRKDHWVLSGNYDPGRAQVELAADLTKVNLQPLAKWLGQTGWTVTAGEIDTHLDLHYNLRAPAAFSYTGTARSAGAVIHLDQISSPLTVNRATLDFNSEKINFQDLNFSLWSSTYTLTGTIDSYRGPAPDFHIDIKSADFNLGDVLSLAGEKYRSGWQLKGTGQIAVMLSGLPGKFKIDTTLDAAQGEIAGWPFKQLQMAAAWQDRVLTIQNLTLQLAQGPLAATGMIAIRDNAPPEILAADMNWEHFSLAVLNQYGWSGKGYLRFSGRGTWPDLQGAGVATLRGVLYHERPCGDFSADFRTQKKQLIFSGRRAEPAASFNGVLELKPQQIVLNKLLVMFANQGQLNIHGTLTAGADKRINLAIAGKDLPAQELAPFIGTNKLSGGLTINGSFNGTLAKPELQVAFYSDDLSVAQVKMPVKGNFHLAGAPGKFEVRGDLNTADYKATFNFLENKGCQGSVTSVAPPGSLEVSWNADLQKGKENTVELQSEMKDFQWAKLKVNGHLGLKGKLQYNGKIDFTGRIASEHLVLNDQPVVLYSSCLLHDNELNFNADLNDEYILEGKIAMGRQPQISGTARINLSGISAAGRLWNIPELTAAGGSLKIVADLSGSLYAPQIDGRITMANGQWRGFVFSDLTGEWRWHDRILYLTNLEIKQEKEDYLLVGKIPAAPDLPWWLHVNIQQAGLANLGKLIKQDGLAGIAQAEIKVSGTRQDPRAACNLVVNDLVYRGFKSKGLSGDLTFADRTVTFSNLVSENGQGKLFLVPGSKIGWREDQTLNFDLTLGLRNINFNNILLFGEVSCRGDEHDCALTLKSLYVNQHLFSGDKIRLAWTQDEIDLLPLSKKDTWLTGKIKMPGGNEYILESINWLDRGKTVLQANGRIKYPGSIQLFLAGQNQGLPASTVSELLGLKTEVSGQIIFNLDIQGRWSNPDMDGSFHAYKGYIGELWYDDLSGDFTLKDEVLQIQSASLSGANRYKLDVKGAIPLSAKGKYDLDVNIPDSSAEMLALWTAGIKKASGRMTAGFTVTGPADLPVVNGSLNINEGEIYPALLTRKLSKLELKLSVENNRVNIDKFSAAAAAGVLQATGYFTLTGSRVETIDLEVKTVSDRGLPLNLPGFIDTGEVKGILRIAGQYKSYRIGGDLELANAHFTYPPKKTSDWSGGGWWTGAQWDLAITSGENTWYENDLAEVNIKGKLAFTGSSEDIKVSGQIVAVRGTLRYLGSDFRIRQAELDFHNNTAYLAGQAEAAVTADTIVLEVNKSKLEEVRPRFYSRSDPQLPQEKVIAKLMYGSDVNSVAKEDQSKVLVRELLKVMDNTLNTKIIRPVVRKLGLDKMVDVVQVRTEVAQRSVADPQTSIWQGSELKVGKYLTNRVFLGYNTILEQSVIPNKLELKHQLEMDYQLKGSKYLKMHIDEKERFLGIENQIQF